MLVTDFMGVIRFELPNGVTSCSLLGIRLWSALNRIILIFMLGMPPKLGVLRPNYGGPSKVSALDEIDQEHKPSVSQPCAAK